MQIQLHATIRSDDQGHVTGWAVHVLDGDGQPLRDISGEPLVRTMRRGGTPPYDLWSFPLPPEGEAQALAADAPHTALCQADDEAPLQNAFARLLGRNTGDGTVEQFGRYLFTCLLGDDVWTVIQNAWAAPQDADPAPPEAAGAKAYELSLCWAADDPVLNRFPWEMMHDGETFVATRPEVALTRRIGNDDVVSPQAQAPPRVLFVLGTGIDDDIIRPGAEYIGLVKTLQYANLDGWLQTSVLVQATTDKLAATLDAFHPTIVHFICHGDFSDGGRSYLKLYDEEKPEQGTQLYVDNLLTLLAAHPPLPHVIVLSACHSAQVDATSHAGEPAMPYAAELVGRGIPVVVGMTGQVADRACRLFTAAFYHSLLKHADLPRAAADGRRAAIQHEGYNLKDEIDWALPALFLAEGLTSTRLTFAPPPRPHAWLEAARRFNKENFPPFCDRLHVLDDYHALMADPPLQKKITGENRFFQVLAYATRRSDLSGEDVEQAALGRSWLLKELAAKAARDGHLPVLVDKMRLWREERDWPTTLPELMRLVRKAIRETERRFSSIEGTFEIQPEEQSYVRDLLRMDPGASCPDDWPEELCEDWDEDDPGHADQLAIALRLDLLDLLKRARASLPAEVPDPERQCMKLLLLFDDLHLMGAKAVSGLMNPVLGRPFSLQGAAADIRVAFAYSAKGQTPEEDLTIQAINDGFAEILDCQRPLSVFQSGLEERLAYQHLLYNWREGGRPDGEIRRLTTVVEKDDATRKRVEWFYKKLAARVKGIPSYLSPSYLKRERVAKWIEDYADPDFPFDPILREASDDDAWDKLKR